MSDGQGEAPIQDQNNNAATVNASDAAKPTDDASKESVYAANRALYESSLAGQQQQSNLPNFDFQGNTQQQQTNGEAAGQGSSANGAAETAPAGDAGQTGKRRLVRAGDLEASRNGSTEPSATQPGTDSNALATQQPPQPESMRDKIRAARGGSVGSGAGSPATGAFSPSASTTSVGGNPFVAQPQYANGSGQVMSEVDKMIETSARAFSAKNPHVPIDKVRQALQHSKGAFDATFSTALKILLNSATGQQSATPAGSPPAFSPQNSTSSLPGQSQAYQPSMRYPGQNTAPAQSPPYPGSAAYQNMSQSQGGQQPGASPMNPNVPLHPHQMAGPPGSAANPNGLTPGSMGGVSPFNGQMLAGPPPPVLPGTHPSIGFSALQILPAEQHQQFLQLAPNQQTDYSMQVYQALGQDQQKHYAQQGQAQQRMRDAWNRQQQASGSMMMIPPGTRPGATGASANPYIGYASHNPTQQQQAMQQRFPGQNPVFRVGAPQAGAASSQQPTQTEIARQQHFLQEQHRILIAQLSPPERAQVLALPVAQQQQWVMQQVHQRMEHQKRQAAQHHRTQQQQMMAQKHQEHKQKMSGAAATPVAAPATKKRRRRGHSDSDEEELNLNDDSSGDDNDDDDDMDGGEGSEAEAERESKAIEWFNSTSTTELMEMTGCKAEQADAVVEMRPYANPSDIRGKLRKRKGVSGNLFDNYVDLMHSYGQTDECLTSCREIGKELEHILSIWTGGTKVEVTESMRPSVEPEDVKAAVKVEDGQVKTEEVKPEVSTLNGSLAPPSAAPSRLGTPTLAAESSANVGAALIEISEAVLQQSRNQDASEEVKKAFEGYLYEQPKLLEEGVKLKNYQLLGVNWLKLLYEKNISCILADEMGLGKTIQVIAFLAHLKETEKPGPHLVVVPSSTLDNWIREFEKFAPSLKVYAYYGTQAERVDARYFLKQEKDLDVLVTTYNMATGSGDDRKFLKKMEFKVCVFDEGHQLKNAESKKYKDLMELKVGWRLLLTGTPLQNNLQELVSLLSFILPKIFSDAQDSLRAIFKVPPDAHKNLLTRQRVRHAKQVMTPFVLRRKKAQVLRDLPPKIELVEYCEMSDRQRDIYRETLEKHRKAVVEYAPSGTSTPADGTKPPPKKRGRANVKSGKQVQENSTSNVLMALRKAANHPMLFRRHYDDKLIKQMAKECLKEEEFADRNVDYIVEDMDLMTDFELHRFVQPYKYLNKYGLKNEEWMDAGKVKKLMQMIPEIKARGDRILIFSQFVSVLEILGLVLETMGMKFLTLTGQTNVNDRQGLVDEFTEDDTITCFLLSTRAGGLGLNLMAANVVIIMDMDFNPHNDKQAQDRAYRLGQTKEVTIYKFVTRGTIEEDMLALADTKLALDEQVSAESAVSGDLAEKNLEIDEGQEGAVEKKVKASLMQTLQKRFEGDDTEYQQTQAAAPDVKVNAPNDIPVGTE